MHGGTCGIRGRHSRERNGSSRCDRIFDQARQANAVIEHVERNREDFFFLKRDDFATEYEDRVVVGSRGGRRLRNRSAA